MPGTLQTHNVGQCGPRARSYETSRSGGWRSNGGGGAERSYRDLEAIVRILPFTLKKKNEAVEGFAKRRDVV